MADPVKPAVAGTKPNTSAKPAPKKTECPISRKEFEQLAIALDLGEVLKGKYAATKEFSSGGLGWFFNEKFSVKIGDKVVKIQPTLSFSVVGSKDLPTDE